MIEKGLAQFHERITFYLRINREDIMHKLIPSYLIFFFLFSFSLFGQDIAIKNAYVNSDSLIIRAKAATFYERLGQLKRNDLVKIVSEKEDWYEILLPANINAWVRAEYLDENGTVISDTCFLSAGAGDSFTSFYRVPPAVVLKKSGLESNGWVQVQVPSTATAWVSSSYVILEEDMKKVPAVVALTQKEVGALEKQRQNLKEQHAQQQEKLLQEQERLQKLREEAEKLKQVSEKDSQVLTDLQREAMHLQALKDAAEAKAALAKLEREKALRIAAEEQSKLELQRKEAQEKSTTIKAEKDKWEAEAGKTALAIEELRKAAQEQAQQALAEVQKLEKEREAAVIKAEEALMKAAEAEEQKALREKQQALTQEAINELQKELKSAEDTVSQLRMEREKMELAAREEIAKLEAAKIEADKLALEKREIALKIEASKKEREEIKRLAEEDAKKLAALKKESKEKVTEELLITEEEGRQRLLLTVPDKKTEEQAKQIELGEIKTIVPAAEAVAETTEVKVAETVVETTVTVPEVVEESPNDKKAETVEVAEKPVEEPVEEKQLQVEKSSAADGPKRDSKSGVVVSLREKATRSATHVLCERVNFTLRPICYLTSNLLDLRQWESQEVKVQGQLVELENWSRPIIIVDGIIKN